jgi:hypothetical protein
MKLIKSLTMLAGLAALTLGGAAAQAATIVGGVTAVTLTAAPTLTSLGLSFSTLGTATAMANAMGIPTINFPITGGTIDTNGRGLIEHNGSGLLFTAGATTLALENFLIDTNTSQLFGRATANGTVLGVIPVFDITTILGLKLTPGAAGALTSLFGAPNLSGVQVGFASVNPTLSAAVPEPASWAMMIGGFGLIGMGLRRRRTARATVTVSC